MYSMGHPSVSSIYVHNIAKISIFSQTSTKALIKSKHI